MDFFSKGLTAKDYQNLDKKGCIVLPDRKIESVLNLKDFWIVVLRDADEPAYVQVFATQNLHGMMTSLLDLERSQGAYENIAGSLSQDDLNTDFNKMISDLMQRSNVLIRQVKTSPINPERTIGTWQAPDEKLTSKDAYNKYILNCFIDFDKIQSTEEMQENEKF
jgi:hypothetical protein